MKNVTLTSIIGVDPEFFDLVLLRHYIQYYKDLGIENFNIIINALSENRIKEGYDILMSYGITPEIWIGEFFEHTKIEKLHRLHRASKTPWIFHTDGDEFVEIKDLEITIQDAERQGKFIFSGYLVDRVCPSFKLEAPKIDVSPFEQYSATDYITRNDLGITTHKVFLLNPLLYKISYGAHYGEHIDTGVTIDQNLYYPTSYSVAHFKWTATAKKRTEYRINRVTDQAPGCRPEHLKTLEILNERYK